MATVVLAPSPARRLTAAPTAVGAAIGSTTGGVLVSENRRDHWTAAEARLPPVHAVRFAA